MANQQILEGNWNEVKGKLRDRWSQLTEDDLADVRGRIDRLAGIIQRNAGEGREAIEIHLRAISGEVLSTLSAAAKKTQRDAGEADYNRPQDTAGDQDND